MDLVVGQIVRLVGDPTSNPRIADEMEQHDVGDHVLLDPPERLLEVLRAFPAGGPQPRLDQGVEIAVLRLALPAFGVVLEIERSTRIAARLVEIGRASCRESVCKYV